MWFRQHQSMDTDRIRVSLKNQMRRFRSSDSSATPSPTSSPIADKDHLSHNPPQQQPSPFAPPNSSDQTDNHNAMPSGCASLTHNIVQQIHCDSDDKHGRPGQSAVVPPTSTNVQRSSSGRRLSKTFDKSTSLVEPRFKGKRPMKSSSKGKLAELDKNRFASGRKSSAPPDLDTAHIAKSTATAEVTNAASSARKHVRSHSNLNFNALLRYKLTNRMLSTVDFDSMRRKSLTGDSFLGALVRSKELAALSTAAKEAEAAKTVKAAGADRLSTPSRADVEANVSVDCNADGQKSLVVSWNVAAADANKKSPSLGARVAAHFADGSVSARQKLSKLSKSGRKTSRTAGVYTQNSFGN